MRTDSNKLNMFVTNKVFIVLDLIGVLVIIAHFSNFFSDYFEGTLLTIGMTFLTLGITIPISLYFQTKQSNDSFTIINACHNYGIENLFEGRKYNKSYGRIRRSVNDAFENTNNLWLLGIAFPELLNPESASDSAAKRCLKDTRVNVEVILLNPDSEAARRRAEIEDPDEICDEGETIRNIRSTIYNHVKIIMRARLENRYGKEWKIIINEFRTSMDENDFFNKIIEAIKIRIKITELDPIAFVITTDNTLFSEQYSFGRPDVMDTTATCIGGYLPILQYKRSSCGYDFLKSHFNYVWNHENLTKDMTIELLDFINPSS
ncbi:MAG: hypothetical protein HN590_10880 [Calditrichaeota bacterium]|nr:hypothetical protein [Calditrichota bacterium]MBT7790364.1 hypothetical protein [Calditrichota bacterium]